MQNETKQGNKMSYNGWANRATWLINVWFNPESRADVESARFYFESAVDELPDFLRDFVDQDIDWDELMEHFDEEEEEEEA